jgi:hypothetical protein
MYPIYWHSRGESNALRRSCRDKPEWRVTTVWTRRLHGWIPAECVSLNRSRRDFADGGAVSLLPGAVEAERKSVSPTIGAILSLLPWQ